MDPTLSSLKDVLLLFLIPIGGGIPAGVVLAKTRAISWPTMMGLYFISDVMLACVFDPCMHLFVRAAKTSPRLTKFADSYKASLARTGFKFGLTTRPLALIAIAFGVDPMTGRAATYVAGHGFISGWALSICGDMIFFTLIMASTLWLDNVLGDGTLAAVIVMIAMLTVPALIRRLREKFSSKENS